MRILFVFLLALSLLATAFASPDNISQESNNTPVDSTTSNNQHSSELPPDFIPLAPEVETKAKNEGSKFTFATEVNRLMKLIINSLYKTKEIFLRELISNASDALDKIRFLTLTNSSLLNENPNMKITIVLDPKARTITLTDTGIGMTRDDLRNNLGTIAKSGTAEFLANENKTADAGLIGQFGVGFYSVFLVSESVTVISKHPNDTQHIWESTSDSDYTLYEDPRGNTLGRGTQVIMHLKADASEYLDAKRITELVKKHSEFIHFPIKLWTPKTITEEVPVDGAEGDAKKEQQNKEDQQLEDDVEDVEDETSESSSPKTKKIEKTVYEWARLNENKPIWTKSPKDLEFSDYHRFYSKFTKDDSEPLSYIHFKAEGEVQFSGLIFLPPSPAIRFLDGQAQKELTSYVKLYVRRVLITDDMQGFLPRYLASVRGVIDSDDLPLNVSRETLQQHAMLKIIKKKTISKILEMFKNLSQDKEKYSQFMQYYGTFLKYGVIEDFPNRKKLQGLLRFNTTYGSNITGFDEYITRMRKGQKQMYFLTGTSTEEMKQSPFVEKVVSRGYEVLLMSAPIDEFVMQVTPVFNGFNLQNVAKQGLKFGDDEDEAEEKRKKEQAEKFKPLLQWMTTILKPDVDDVMISDKLVSSPCAVVASQYGASGMMERMIKSQKQDEKDVSRDWILNHPKYFEINAEHPIMTSLLEKIQNQKADERMTEVVRALFDVSLMRSGYEIKSQKVFFKNIENIVRRNLGVDLNAEVKIEVKPAPEIDLNKEVNDTDIYALHDDL